MIQLKGILLLICLVLFSHTIFSQNIDGVYASSNGDEIVVSEFNGGVNIAQGGTVYSFLLLNASNGVKGYMNYQTGVAITANGSEVWIGSAGNVVKFFRSNRGQNVPKKYENQSGGYKQKQESVCTSCKGTGYSSSKTYPPSYGTTPTEEYCGICKSTSRAHTHGLCYSCGGRGVR